MVELAFTFLQTTETFESLFIQHESAGPISGDASIVSEMQYKLRPFTSFCLLKIGLQKYIQKNKFEGMHFSFLDITNRSWSLQHQKKCIWILESKVTSELPETQDFSLRQILKILQIISQTKRPQLVYRRLFAKIVSF